MAFRLRFSPFFAGVIGPWGGSRPVFAFDTSNSYLGTLVVSFYSVVIQVPAEADPVQSASTETIYDRGPDKAST